MKLYFYRFAPPPIPPVTSLAPSIPKPYRSLLLYHPLLLLSLLGSSATPDSTPMTKTNASTTQFPAKEKMAASDGRI